MVNMKQSPSRWSYVVVVCSRTADVVVVLSTGSITAVVVVVMTMDVGVEAEDENELVLPVVRLLTLFLVVVFRLGE